MLSFDDLKTEVGGSDPPFICIYAEPGGGKTTLASEFPNPVFLQTEKGTPGGAKIKTFGKITDFANFMKSLQLLYTEEHDFNTVVVDSATALEKIVFAETCRRGDEKGVQKKRIEDFGYGKGYKNADIVWQEIVERLNALRYERGMIVVIIGHTHVSRFDDPETSSYSRFELSLHERGAAIIENESDIIIFLRRPISTKDEDVGFNKDRAIAQTGRQIMMHLVERATFKAKSRYLVNAPDKIPYVKGHGFEELVKYFPTDDGDEEGGNEDAGSGEITSEDAGDEQTASSNDDASADAQADAQEPVEATNANKRSTKKAA